MAAKKATDWVLLGKRVAGYSAGIFVAVKYREWWHIGEPFEMDGAINAVFLNNPSARAGVIPNDFEEVLLSSDKCKSNKDLVCTTAALYGDNGSLYRRMDLDYSTADYAPLPYQTLIRCKNDMDDEDETTDALKNTPCVPDWKHVMPLYQRLMCQPLVIAEKCIGILKPDQPTRGLVIGLGGGGFAGLLQELYPHMELDIIEIEPVVAQHAQKHFGFAPSPKTTITIADGEEFLRQRAKEAELDPEKKYDVAFVDCYTTGDPPKMMERLTFYQDLDDCMKDKSTLGIHLNTRSDDNFKAWQTAHWQFGSRGCVYRYNPPAVLGTSVIFSHKGWKVSDPLDLANLRLLFLARQWSYEHKLPFDAARRLVRNASAAFPGLEQRYHATRNIQAADEKKKVQLRGRLDSVFTSSAK